MAKNDNLTDYLTDLADGIRAKKGTTDPINPQDFRKEIESISGGGNGGEESEDLDNLIYVKIPNKNALEGGISTITAEFGAKYIRHDSPESNASIITPNLGSALVFGDIYGKYVAAAVDLDLKGRWYMDVREMGVGVIDANTLREALEQIMAIQGETANLEEMIPLLSCPRITKEEFWDVSTPINFD